MNLQYRINLLSRLGEYILSGDENWQSIKGKAGWENGWFIPEFVNKATEIIANNFLQKKILAEWTSYYQFPENIGNAKTIGVVMAGNIPLVGFHDFLCGFISGHKVLIKASVRDQVLIKHLVEKLIGWAPELEKWVEFSEMLKGCDAYIATGSNNSSRYFEFYFDKYPNIIRRNKTSVALLTGEETTEDLEKLADDVYLYFGLGCRNVTKIYVPVGYDFIPLLEAFKKYNYLADHHKYKNNYDYNLALHLLNKKYYMSNGSILLIEEPALFSPISQLNYDFFSDTDKLTETLKNNNDLQCIVGKGFIPFGKGQSPAVSEYADGVDTLRFLTNL
jgi:hypothetical protein